MRAVRDADVREGRGFEGGTAVPVAIEVKGRRLADEVILQEEGGAWRIHAVPLRRLSELLLPPERPSSEGTPQSEDTPKPE